jgi:hypothetical protein
MGCSADAALEAVPAKWNPCYNPCLLLGLEQPEVIHEAYYSLGFRAESLAYWRLCRKMIDEATGSDYVIIVEQLPEQDLSEYWYVLVIARADRVAVYTGGTDPFGNIDLGDQDDEIDIASGSPGSAAPCHVGADKFREVLSVMKECDVWNQIDQIYAFPKYEQQPIGQAPVMIHVFRGADKQTIDFLLADPVPTPSAIAGRLELDSLKDSSQAWFGARQEITPTRERLFRQSLPARCVLNSALMLLANSRR